MEFDLSVVRLALENVFDCFSGLIFFSDVNYHLSILPCCWFWLLFQFSQIFVYLELVLLKIWRELVAFMWRVMGGAILQVIVLSVFWLRCAVEIFAWYLLILQFDPVDTTVWSFWKFVKSDMIGLSFDMYQVFMFHADIHRWMVSFRAMVICIRILDIILRWCSLKSSFNLWFPKCFDGIYFLGYYSLIFESWKVSS